MLSPQQNQMLSQFKMQPNNKQAEMIADYCNKNGISKTQLANILGMMKK